MIQLMLNGYFDLIMLTAVMYLGTKSMDKVHIRAFIKTTLLTPTTDTFFVAIFLVFSYLKYPNILTIVFTLNAPTPRGYPEKIPNGKNPPRNLKKSPQITRKKCPHFFT